MIGRPGVGTTPRLRPRSGTALIGRVVAEPSCVLEDIAGPSVLVLTEWINGRSVVVSVTGEVDIASAPQLSEALCAALASGGDRLICDLGGVSFLDASGLRVLLNARQSAIASGARLDLVCTQLMPRKVIRLTGVDALVPCHDTLARAAEAQEHGDGRIGLSGR